MKILIIRLGAVGDVIRTIPVVDYLSKRINNPEISWLVEDRASNLLIDYPLIKNLYIIPRKKYYKIISTIQQIRREKFDVVLDFHGLLKSGLMSFFSGVKVRIGFHKKNSKEFNYIFNNIHAPALPEKITRIEKNFYLLKAFLDDVSIPEELEVSINIEKEKEHYINNFVSPLKKEFKYLIGVNPFVSKAGRYKEWPLEYYAKLINILNNKLKNTCFIITWGPGELEKAQKLISLVKNKNVFLAPKTDMKELAVLLKHFSLFITGDTGPMHLASILGTLIVAIFGPSDVEINRPWGKNNIVVYKDVGCNPCRNKSCKNLKCLKEVTPEFVLKFIDTSNFL